MKSTTTGGRAHNPALDAVRGLAILLVMVCHVAYDSGLRAQLPGEAALMTAMEQGSYGVDLFFVLSGFLITGIILKARDQPEFFRNFYARRILRIWPLYLLFLTVMLLAIPLVFAVPAEWQRLLHDQRWFWLHLTNFKILQNGDFISPYLNHTWSLAVEEQFYFVWPLFLWWTPRRWTVPMIIGVILAATATRFGLHRLGYSVHVITAMTPARMDTLATGGLLAALSLSPRAASYRSRWIMAALLAAAALMATRPLIGVAKWDAHVSFPFTTLLFSALVATAQDPNSQVGRFLCQRRLLKILGKYSYGLYLWHQPLFFAVGGSFAAWALQRTGSLVLALGLFGVVWGSVAFALAWLSYHLYEMHWLKLKSYF